MKSVYNFVVTPIGERYNNTKEVEGGDLIMNTEIYNHQFINRIAKVISTPIIGDTDIKPEKVTDEQLKEVQDLINGINRSQMELGQMETKKHAVLHNIATVKDGLSLIQSEFEKEYGTVDINIKDGTINYPSDNGETDKKD